MEREQNTRQYKLIKNFSLKDLIVDKAPVELIEECYNTYIPWESDDFNQPIFNESHLNVEYNSCFKSLNEGHPWFVENGYLAEIEQDTILKPGMILETFDRGNRITLVVDSKGLVLQEGWSEQDTHTYYRNHGFYYGFYNYTTLSHLNSVSKYKWRVVKPKGYPLNPLTR